jgi:uncharacterized membrane protein YccC
MSPANALALVARTLLRARARTITTVLGCTLGAAVIAFFLTAEHALARSAQAGSDEIVLQVAQKDRF